MFKTEYLLPRLLRGNKAIREYLVQLNSGSLKEGFWTSAAQKFSHKKALRAR